jgi:HEAT repeat protein
MAKLLDSPTSVLLSRAVSLFREESESDERWDVFYTLKTRGDEETFDAVKTWCDSTDVIERALAADLLNQFGESVPGIPGRGVIFTSAARTAPLLKKLIDDPEIDVITTSIIALGWNGAYDIILARSALATHSSPRVRFAVACGLNGSENQAAVDILIALAGDEDDDVRDRANWVLGCESNLDTPEVREVLFQNLMDSQAETRCEAMVGLARRRDIRAIPYIQKELAKDNVWYMAIEAAAHFASSDFLKPLEDFRSRSDENTELIEKKL